MRSFLVLILCLLSVFSPISFAKVTDLASLQTQLAKNSTLRGQFTQTRFVKLFSKPLISSGRFVLNKSQGLLWQQQTPFEVEFVLTQNKLSQKVANGTPQIVTAIENPTAFYFSQIFLSVFQGDVSQLTQEFKLNLQTEKQRWRLMLTPKTAPLNRVFKQIDINGDENVKSLSLLELRGDKTLIEFSQQSNQPSELSDAEKAQFSF